MSYQEIIERNREWIDEIYEKLDAKLSRLSEKSFDIIPYTTVNGLHEPSATGICAWTNGFWGGLMWIMYSQTRKECYRKTAKHAEQLMDKAWETPEKLHHDVGFQWHIMSGAAYRLVGDEDSLQRELRAAEFLANRYNEKGEYIVAWNSDYKAGWSIIDTMMNIPLLYWASEYTGDEKYARIARKHADMAMRDHIRPDGSVVHIVSHTTDRVGVIETFGGQGYGVGSSWSRGASWAVYGFALSYIHTGEQKYLDAAKRVAHYFISNVALSDWMPLVDFRAPADYCKYDSTAGVITACGLIEIAKHVPELESELYMESAIKILKAIEKRFADWSEDEDGILLGGSLKYGKDEEVHIIYGDYYLAEAISKLRGNAFLPW